jgi:hypothetical protein
VMSLISVQTFSGGAAISRSTLTSLMPRDRSWSRPVTRLTQLRPSAT